MSPSLQEAKSETYDWTFGLIQERVEWATIVLKELFHLLGESYKPSNMVDYGGGAGSWCVAAKHLGIDNVLLIDRCPPNQVIKSLTCSEQHECNLEHYIPAVGHFDLAISIEVAEHLTAPNGELLIEALCNSSSLVLFAAAIPGQGGIGHINEQPHEYWHERFSALGYECFDILRPRLISNAEIPWWLKQNLFLYQKVAQEKGCENLSRHLAVANGIELIHTVHLRRLQNPILDLRTILKAFPSAFRRSIMRKIS
jgi:hypothetical protein